MEIVAQVFDWKITKTELDFEENCLKSQYPHAETSDLRNYALTQLIDRYLLVQEAINHGISVDDDELEIALLEMLDGPDSLESSVLVNRKGRGNQLERFVKNNIVIQKYVESLNIISKAVTEQKLYQFYLDHSDYFCREPEVRVSQILSKGVGDDSLNRINKIRDNITCCDDFLKILSAANDNVSDITYGDLGYFPQGRMIPKLEKVAFSLNVNEVSKPFKTKLGYHILMVTDKKNKQIIPFDNIKEGLKESLLEIEEELTIAKLLKEVRENNNNSIRVFEQAFL